MIGCLRTHVRKQPIIALYFEFENELKFYYLEARSGSKLFAKVQRTTKVATSIERGLLTVLLPLDK